MRRKQQFALVQWKGEKELGLASAESAPGGRSTLEHHTRPWNRVLEEFRG